MIDKHIKRIAFSWGGGDVRKKNTELFRIYLELFIIETLFQ